MAMRHSAHARTKRLQAHEAEGGLDSELFVEHLVRVSDEHERHVFLVRPYCLSRRMEDDDFANARQLDRVRTPDELANMCIEDGTVHKHSALKVNQRSRIRDLDFVACDRFQHLCWESVPPVQFHAGFLSRPLCHSRYNIDVYSCTFVTDSSRTASSCQGN